MPSLCLCACVSVTRFLNVCLHMYVLHKAATAFRGGRYQHAEWHRCSKGPQGQCGVNRPNKVDDYVSVEEPRKQKRPQILPLSFPWISGHTNTHTGGGGGGGTVGFRAVQRVEVEWWRLLLTTKKKEEAEWLQRSNPVKGSHCGESKRPLTTSREQTEGGRQRTSASTSETLKLRRKCSGLCVRV